MLRPGWLSCVFSEQSSTESPVCLFKGLSLVSCLMTQLLIRFLILNIYVFALLCQTGEVTLARNQAKWPISINLLDSALFEFFAFKPSKKPTSNSETVSAKISAKQKPFRSFLLSLPPSQLEWESLPSSIPVFESFRPAATPFGRTPHELFEILIV